VSESESASAGASVTVVVLRVGPEAGKHRLHEKPAFALMAGRRSAASRVRRGAARETAVRTSETTSVLRPSGDVGPRGAARRERLAAIGRAVDGTIIGKRDVAGAVFGLSRAARRFGARQPVDDVRRPRRFRRRRRLDAPADLESPRRARAPQPCLRACDGRRPGPPRLGSAGEKLRRRAVVVFVIVVVVVVAVFVVFGVVSTVRSLFALYGLLSIVVYLAVSVTNIAIWTWVISCTGERYREPLERWTRWFLPPAELAAGRAVAAAEGGEDAEEAGTSAGPEAPAPAEGPADQSDLHPLWPAFLLAVGVNKLLLPVRLTVTALLTRSAAEWLKRWRWAAGLTASRVKAAP
ncbi:MAG: hypothetical protein BJ554DRAFT_3944, partial [Olpidium bornovanus]